jgi:Uma2 family endonuclease
MDFELPKGSQVRRISVEEYFRMGEVGILDPDEKTELLDGVIFTVTKKGSPHALLVERLNVLLVHALTPGYRIRPQLPLPVSEFSSPQPDQAVVRRGQSRPGHHPEHAELIVEVSDSSLSKDRGLKRRIYAQAGVPEYWVVNVPARCIEVSRDPDPATGTYRGSETFAAGAQLKPAGLPGPTVDLTALFAPDEG